ncbi:GTP-binding protein, partial [Mycolicibacterium chitae]
RRGHSTGAHAPLLDGAPPLGADGRVQIVEFGSRRPFHPQRLHDAVDVLLDGVIRAKGRLWLSSQPDRAMWLESAGGGLRVADAGKWLAAMDTSEGAYVDNERRAVANLLWEDGIGDRHTSMTVLVCGAEPAAVLAALCDALLTADELASPDEWPGHHDPFGHWHVDPCDQDQPVDATGPANRTEGDAR